MRETGPAGAWEAGDGGAGRENSGQGRRGAAAPPPAPPRRLQATGASLSGFVYMSSRSSLNGPGAGPSLTSGGRCRPMEEADGVRGANGRREAVPRATRKLGCAGGGAGGSAILDGRGRAWGFTERGGDGAKGEERSRAGCGLESQRDPEAAQRNLTWLGRSRVEAAWEVPRAV